MALWRTLSCGHHLSLLSTALLDQIRVSLYITHCWHAVSNINELQSTKKTIQYDIFNFYISSCEYIALKENSIMQKIQNCCRKIFKNEYLAKSLSPSRNHVLRTDYFRIPLSPKKQTSSREKIINVIFFLKFCRFGTISQSVKSRLQ